MREPAMLRWAGAAAALLLLAAAPAAGFYLPGVAPTDFGKGDNLLVKVNKLTSTKTQVPYTYYSLPFCKPSTIVDSAENLGEVLRGDRVENSPYVFKMRAPRMCQIVCRITVTEKEAKELKEKIEDEYRVNMVLDNLPLVVPVTRQDKNTVAYQGGYHVGVKGQYAGSNDEKYFIHNHLSFVVKYHRDDDSELSRIVGFEVKPYSVKHQFDGKWNTHLSTCDPHDNKIVTTSESPQEVEVGKEIIFTYDVRFEGVTRLKGGQEEEGYINEGVSTKDLRNKPTRDPSYVPPSSSSSSGVMAVLKSIFSICKSNSVKIEKINRRFKKNTLCLKELQRAYHSISRRLRVGA